MFEFVKNKLLLRIFRKKWRKLNAHNFTTPSKIFDSNLVEIGKGTYGFIDIVTYGSKNEKLFIGNYCSIAMGVKFLLGGEHDYNKLSTYPFRVFYLNQKTTNLTKGHITIGDEVWIGYGAFILSGVNVGNGAIIGANTVISKDVPPYAIVIGNPMKIIKYRFTPEIIAILDSLNIYKRMSLEEILKNINLFEEKPSKDLLNKIIEIINNKNI